MISSAEVDDLESNRTYKLIEHEPETLENCLPSVDFQYSTNGGFVEFEVSEWDEVSTASWTFGDGEYSEGQATQHLFSVSSTFQVCLTLTSECGSSTYCEFIDIDLSECDHQTAFEMVQSFDTLFVTDASLGEPSEWSWDFGDGSTSDSSQAQIVYNLPDTYEVCLTTTNVCSQDSSCLAVTILPSDCAPDSELSLLQFGDSISCFGNIMDADSAFWSLGDEMLGASGLDVQLEFDLPGEYDLCLVAFNACSADTSCVVIEVLESDCAPEALFSIDQEGNMVLLYDQSMNSDSLVWSLGDGTAITNESIVEYSYSEIGNFEICLTSFNPCSSDTSCTTIDIVGTSVYDHLTTDLFRIYPNPTDRELLVEWRIDTKAVLSISDQSGKEVLNFQDRFIDRPETRLDVHGLPNGIYTLSLDNLENIIQKSFIVLH